MASDPGRRYSIVLKPSVEKALATVPKRDLAKIAKKIDALVMNPRPAGVEKLGGAEGLYRLRAGDYRVIYAIKDQILQVLVVRVGHRGDVYRRL